MLKMNQKCLYMCLWCTQKRPQNCYQMPAMTQKLTLYVPLVHPRLTTKPPLGIHHDLETHPSLPPITAIDCITMLHQRPHQLHLWKLCQTTWFRFSLVKTTAECKLPSGRTPAPLPATQPVRLIDQPHPCNCFDHLCLTTRSPQNEKSGEALLVLPRFCSTFTGSQRHK